MKACDPRILVRSLRSERVSLARLNGPATAEALETLETLRREGRTGTFDLAFIDADKSSYDHYYERLLEILRPGGYIALDNTLWSGEVLDPKDEDSVAIDTLNRKIARLDTLEDLFDLACGTTVEIMKTRSK